MMKHPILLLALGFVLVYLLPLGCRPLFFPDETRYAEIPREMLSSGAWAVPHLDGLRYFEKPVLGYWITAVSLRLFGQNPFAARLPSALAAGLSAALVFLLAGAARSRLRAWAWAPAAILLSSGLPFVLGVYNVLDGMFACFVTATMVCFYLAWQAEDTRRRLAQLSLAGACCGLAFLTKGFLAFALPALSIGCFLLWQGQWRTLFRLPWLPLAVAVAVCLPWAIVIQIREPDFWRFFVYVEHFRRFADPIANTQHAEPFLFLLPVLLGGAMPWTVLLPAATRRLWREDARDPLVRYALCWCVMPFLFFSLSKGKLGTYILPCFPPLALLLAAALAGREDAGRSRWVSGGMTLTAILAALGAAAAVVLLLAAGGGPDAVFTSAEKPKALAAAFALAATAAAAFHAARRPGISRKLAWYALAPLPLMLATHVALPAGAIAWRAPVPSLNAGRALFPSEALVVSSSHLAPAVAWVLRRSDIVVLGSGGELDYGLEYPEGRDRLLSTPALRKIILDPARSRPVALFLNADRYGEELPGLPPAPTELKRDGFVLAAYPPPPRTAPEPPPPLRGSRGER